MFHLEFSLFFQVGILEAQEIKYTVQSDGIDRLFGIGDNLRFCMESDTESRDRKHRQVVCAVAYSNRLCNFSTWAINWSSSAFRFPSTMSPT